MLRNITLQIEARSKKIELRILPAFFVFCLLISYFFFIASPAYATAGIYRTINFQGKVVNKTGGTNISNGSYSFVFKLYDDPTAGNQLPTGTPWSETQSLTVTDGIFRATLGSSTAIPTALDFNSDTIYLSITFNGELFGSRIRLTAVPYAFNAEKVSGLTVTSTTGTLTIPSATTVAFSGANNLTFTTSNITNATLPSGSITLADTTSTQTLTGKTIGSTGLIFSGASSDITTASNEDLTFAPNGTGIVSIQSSATASANITMGGQLQLGRFGSEPTQLGVGSMYYNSSTNKFRCYQNAAWTDCIGSGVGSSAFSDITGSTNTTAAMVVGTGASLNFTGSGTINASSLLSGTWAIPGTIGSTTPNTGAFTNLSSNGNFTHSGTGTFGTGTGAVSLNGDVTIATAKNLTFTSGAGVITQNFSGTTTTAHTLNVNNLTTGNGLLISSTSTGLTTGNLQSIDWSPGAVSATGDLLSINVGPNAIIGNILDLKDNGGTVLGVSQTAVTSNLPANFTAAGDVGIAYDINFTNPITSFIKSAAPLYIVSGEVFNSSDLTIRTYNSGNVIVDSHLSVSNPSVTGKALSIFNQTEIQDIFTASASGTPKFTIDYSGSATAAANLTMGGQLLLGRFGSEPTQLGVGSMYYNSSTNKFRCYQNAAWTDCIGAGGTPSWDSITAPGGNLALSMGSNTSTFTYGATTSTNNLFNLTDTNSNTGTGYLLNLTTGTSSTLKPLHIAAAGTEALYVNASGNVGVGTLTPTAKLDITGSASLSGTLTVGNGTTNAIQSPYGPLTLNYKSGLNAWTAGLTIQDSTGNIGIGTTTPTSKLHIAGNVTIGAQADSASTGSSTSSLNSAAGTFGSDTSIDKVNASIVFRGKLFIATAETNAAGVYRYDGGTTWTLVTNAVGKAVSGDATDADAFIMAVHNDQLYIANQTGTTTGAIYRSSTADTTSDSFTMVNATRGTSGMSQTTITGYTDMTVYNGNLIVATQLANLAEIGRYDGGSTFTQINATDGKSVAETTADKDGFLLKVYNGYLYSGAITGAATAIVAAYSGNGTTWSHLSGTTGGGAFGAETGTSDVTSMVVHNGSLFIAMSKTAGNAAAVYRLKTSIPVANVAANFLRVNTTVGKLIAGDAADQDSIILAVYNGRLYGASATGASTAALYEYAEVGSGATDWTLMTSTRGTFGADTSIDGITSLVQFNGTLYMGTNETNVASIYTWTKTAQNSYTLRFDSGSSNYGEISFVGNRQLSESYGHMGTFDFSNAISISTGAFDYAEDYPTLDSTLAEGEIVSADPERPEHVVRASQEGSILGIVSTNPGFRLSSNVVPDTGAKWVPIALVGRVPVKVTTSNGPIAIGDSIAMSSIPGVGMKAVKSGYIIGQALSAYSGEGVGTITVFIKNSLSQGQFKGGVDILATLATASASMTEASSSALLSEIYTDRVVSGLIIADRIEANHISGLDEMKDELSLLKFKVSTLEAQLVLPQGTASASLVGLDRYENNIIPSPSGLTLLGKTTVYGLNVIDKLTLGLLTIESDASASGSIQTTLAPLKLQKDSLGNLEIMGSKIIIDTMGAMTVRESITTSELKTTKLTILDTKDATNGAVLASSTGRAEIPIGQTSVVVATAAVNERSLIFVTPVTIPVGVSAKQVGDSSIEITISTPMTEVVRVNWWIIN